jgi:hypothetical protein
MASRKVVNIGAQQFDRLIEENKFYIDKTGFIREWWETGADVTLITRPRRFGKTLNMSMVECFFSNQYAGRSDLFEGLSIWTVPQNPEDKDYRLIQGTFPVIFLSFAKIKAADSKGMKYAMSSIIFEAYQKNRFLCEGDFLSEAEKRYFNSIEPGMEMEIAVDAIYTLSNFLCRYYDKRVIILLDEYDTPMQEAWISGYWDEAVRFFGNFFNASFKTNPYMQRALITGITRVSKESIFSDFNNPEVITTTSDKYASYFGFTEQEVFQALEEMGLEQEKEGVKRWYDGFTFGSVTGMYNPWSVVSFIASGKKYKTYWADTSSNGLVDKLIREGSAEIKKHFEMLLEGQSILVPIDEQIVYNQLEEYESAIWSLLLAGGYLKVLSVEGLRLMDNLNEEKYELALTNYEVRRMFAKMIRGWFRSTTEVYNEFIKALLSDNVKKMNTFMNKVALNTFSFFDSGTRPSQGAAPERFYHGFVLGMVIDLADRYKVCSNRESGYGRYDVLLKPLDKREKAFIFEFKVLDPDENELTLEDTLANAHAQIEEKQYAAELAAEGFAPAQLRKYGFAFQGKKCLIG